MEVEVLDPPDDPGNGDWRSKVSQDWRLLADAPDEVRADSNVICEAMRDSSGQALRFASAELRSDREFLLGAAQEMGPAVLEHASDELRASRDFIMEVADYCNPGDIVAYLPQEVRAELLSDRAFVLEAAKQVGAEVLGDASMELRADKSFILAAAEHCVSVGEAVQYASDELKAEFYGDRTFMLKAMEDAGPSVLEDAADELRRDRDFLLAASERSSLEEVLPYASEEMRLVFSSKPKAKPLATATVPRPPHPVATAASKLRAKPPPGRPEMARVVPTRSPGVPIRPRRPAMSTQPILSGPCFPMSMLPQGQLPMQPVLSAQPLQPVQPTVALLSEKKVGVQVRRGPDWVWENQDGGEGQVGTTENHSEPGWIQVRWCSGQCGVYRIGLDGCFDLLEVLPAPPVVQQLPQPVLFQQQERPLLPVAAATVPGAAAARPVPPWRRREAAGDASPKAASPAAAATAVPAATVEVTLNSVSPVPVAPKPAPEPVIELQVQAGSVAGVASDPRKRGAGTAVPPWHRNSKPKIDEGPGEGAGQEIAGEGDSDELPVDALAEVCAELLAEVAAEEEKTAKASSAKLAAAADGNVSAAEAAAASATPKAAAKAVVVELDQPTPEGAEASKVAAGEGEAPLSAAEEGIQAVKELGPEALETVPAELRGDREFMLIVSRYCPLADVLRHVSDELHRELFADREFVLRAVEEIGVPMLANAAETLKADLGFMMEAAALCSCGAAEALKYASTDLQEELEGGAESDGGSELSL